MWCYLIGRMMVLSGFCTYSFTFGHHWSLIGWEYLFDRCEVGYDEYVTTIWFVLLVMVWSDYWCNDIRVYNDLMMNVCMWIHNQMWRFASMVSRGWTPNEWFHLPGAGSQSLDHSRGLIQVGGCSVKWVVSQLATSLTLGCCSRIWYYGVYSRVLSRLLMVTGRFWVGFGIWYC